MEEAPREFMEHIGGITRLLLDKLEYDNILIKYIDIYLLTNELL